ncbi:MAG: hypothetical protein WA890_23035, partial [Micromonospora sp.]
VMAAAAGGGDTAEYPQVTARPTGDDTPAEPAPGDIVPPQLASFDAFAARTSPVSAPVERTAIERTAIEPTAIERAAVERAAVEPAEHSGEEIRATA